MLSEDESSDTEERKLGAGMEGSAEVWEDVIVLDSVGMLDDANTLEEGWALSEVLVEVLVVKAEEMSVAVLLCLTTADDPIVGTKEGIEVAVLLSELLVEVDEDDESLALLELGSVVVVEGNSGALPWLGIDRLETKEVELLDDKAVVLLRIVTDGVCTGGPGSTIAIDDG